MRIVILILVLVCLGGSAEAKKNDNPNPPDPAGCEENPSSCGIPDPSQQLEPEMCANLEFFEENTIFCWAMGYEQPHTPDGTCSTSPDYDAHIPSGHAIDWSTCDGDYLPPFTCATCDPAKDTRCTPVLGLDGVWGDGVRFDRCWWGDTHYRDGSIIVHGGRTPGWDDDGPVFFTPWSPWSQRSFATQTTAQQRLGELRACVDLLGTTYCTDHHAVLATFPAAVQQ